jgi:hypothetical protein
MQPTVLDVCAGIGGFALGFQRAGFRPIGFVENDEFCRRILAKHWPDVPCWDDVHTATPDVVQWLAGMQTRSKEAIMSGKKDPKYAAAPALYEDGLSIQDVADFYGVTRQAMYKILQRRGTKFRSRLRYGEDNHFYRGGPTSGQRRAGRVVEQAIKKGILVPKSCEVCHATGSFADGRNGIQAHHDDYRKPLAVRWLCQSHHHEWHKHNRAAGDDEEPADATTVDVVVSGFP